MAQTAGKVIRFSFSRFITGEARFSNTNCAPDPAAEARGRTHPLLPVEKMSPTPQTILDSSDVNDKSLVLNSAAAGGSSVIRAVLFALPKGVISSGKRFGIIRFLAFSGV
ncbi:MAG: hypothetical protein LBR29_07960 [Methylobacteriaceae bacterium]|nr:hypothetical protein [Methylobacteriaceae bacterium]